MIASSRRGCAGSLVALVILLLALACGSGASFPSAQQSPSPLVTSAPTVTASPEPAVVTLAAVGDIMLGRTIGEGIRLHGPLYPFQFVAPILREADLAFANLESPLTEGGTPAPKDFVFRGPPEGARGLAQAGLDLVSLANNHALDYGLTGLADTFAALQAAGLPFVGAGPDHASARAPIIIEAHGLRLAFLAYVNTPSDSVSGFDVSATAATADRPGVAWATVEAIAQDVASAAPQADLVVVSLHTGPEYRDGPSALQAALARAAVDAGAALVLGHHPHVLQGVERYGQGLIIYSLGNFVFDFDYLDYAQPGLPSALSAVLQLQLTRDGVIGCRIVAIYIDPADGLPRPADGPQAQAVLDRLRRLSDGSCFIPD